MFLNISDKEIAKHKDELHILIANKGIEVEKIKDGQWLLKNKKYGIDKLLLKSDELFKNFGYKFMNTSARPHYAILDDKNMEINFIFIRTQMGTGSVVQKLGYSVFVLTDYIRCYPKIKEFDLRISNVMTSFHKDESLSELILYLKRSSINVWINKINI